MRRTACSAFFLPRVCQNTLMSSPQVIFRKALPADYPGILRLQAENLRPNLDESGARDGFLTVEYTEAQIDEMNRDLAVIIAARGGEVAGYLCATSWEYARKVPILEAMLDSVAGMTIRKTLISPTNTCVYGPVCVTAQARGTGILEGLFSALKRIAPASYLICALFISAQNRRSLRAHKKKLHMQEAGLFEFRGSLYHALVASLRTNHSEDPYDR